MNLLDNLYETKSEKKSSTYVYPIELPKKTQEDEIKLKKLVLKTSEETKKVSYGERIEAKILKQDTFVLEKYSEEGNTSNANRNDIKTWKNKKMSINLISFIFYKIKHKLGFHLNENDEEIKAGDEGFNRLISGEFLFKTLQEFELLKMLVLNEKQFFLFHYIKKPEYSLILEKIRLKINSKSCHLFPLLSYERKIEEMENQNIKKFIENYEKSINAKDPGLNSSHTDKILMEIIKNQNE